MPSIHDYAYYIFDCDGVILDSNRLKIDAMLVTLQELGYSEKSVSECVTYFANNFGKSRFHHVDIFLERFLSKEIQFIDVARQLILRGFSVKCSELYLKAPITPGFIEFIESLKGHKYVASGSEQTELRNVLSQRGLNSYFVEIYGSPTRKPDLVKTIVGIEKNTNTILFGDAVSDFDAAKANDIAFCAYLPYSNVKKDIENLANHNDCQSIDSWSEL